MGWEDRQARQKVIDEYLAETRRSMYLPGEFVNWLKERPDHEAYEMFFGMSVEDAAQEHWIVLATHGGMRYDAL